jgi:hypothetical protein
MSQKYPGGFITKSPVAPTSTAASGIWTLDQQQQAQKAGTWPSPPNYIEEVFSTYLYTGTGQQQAIPNGIDLASKGGMIWTKSRSNATSNILFDTVQGWYDGGGSHLYSNYMSSNNTNAQAFLGYGIGYPMLSNGYYIGFDDGAGTNACDTNIGGNGRTFASWTFAEQPKFFDVVTYTGTGSARTVAHNLGSVPGFIIVKSIGTARNWTCYHRSLGAVNTISLNLSTAASSSPNDFNSTLPTASVFTVGTDASLNASGVQYVAYLFAHDAGGFGLTGADNVVSCGSYAGTGDPNGPIITLGYEPQWVMIKKSAGGTISDGSSSWIIIDNMRGFTDSDQSDPYLNPNLASAESSLGGSNFCRPLPTGFQLTSGANLTNENGATYIYIAIRRGPMKTPTTGTSVFTPLAVTVPPYAVTAGFPVDLAIFGKRTGSSSNRWLTLDRLRGGQPALITSSLAAENTSFTSSFASNTQFTDGWSSSGDVNVYECFRRAPGFFDEVCYTGTGTPTTFTHNLGVVPELMIVKRRDGSSIWAVYAAPLASAPTKYLQLNEADGELTVSVLWNNTAPTSTVFTIGASSNINTTGSTNVAYLFASVSGVSRIGSYTGTGTTQTINCGFTAGARFVMIKRTDSTGDWFVWDTARGMIPANDPYLRLNLIAAEVTGTDFVDTTNVGFEITSTAPAAINASGGTFIFLAIA